MRRLFGSWGNVALYSLSFVAVLAIGGAVFTGVSILQENQSPVERAQTPTVEDQEAPKTAEKEEESAPEEPSVEEPAVEEPAVEEEAGPQFDPAPYDGTLHLNVPKMGRYNDLVLNDISEATLDQGAGKLPSSGFPWEPGSNTYIAAHVLGWEGTNSWLQFANLPNMVVGDEIYLTDSAGKTYTYAVSEILTVTPYDVWVTQPEPGRDMVTLQTCVGENYEWRLIVRGDRIA